MACRAIGLQPGDEVITTPYTFVASSSCILNAFAIPVFVDIDPETYNIDAGLVEAAITGKTRAILPVHFGGNIADMSRLQEIARRRKLSIIEDSAQAQGASLWAIAGQAVSATLGSSVSSSPKSHMRRGRHRHDERSRARGTGLVSPALRANPRWLVVRAFSVGLALSDDGDAGRAVRLNCASFPARTNGGKLARCGSLKR